MPGACLPETNQQDPEHLVIFKGKQGSLRDEVQLSVLMPLITRWILFVLECVFLGPACHQFTLGLARAPLPQRCASCVSKQTPHHLWVSALFYFSGKWGDLVELRAAVMSLLTNR